VSRRLRLSLLVLGCPLILAAIALLAVLVAARHEPAFYRKALEADPAELSKGSDRMLRQAAALQSTGQREGRWEASITAVEINGWLAVDLPKNHPDALPPTLHDPRVAISPNGINIGCRFDGSVTSVLSLTVQPYLAEPNVIALRIVRARSGALPIPLGRVLDWFSEAARAGQLQLQWRRTGDDPVALISLPVDDDSDRTVRIDAVELRDGEIYIAGSTERRKP
jgi:hypothetical protein